MSYVFRVMMAADICRVFKDASETMGAVSATCCGGVVGGLESEGRIGWVVDESINSYFYKLSAVQGRYSFSYILYYNGCYILLELHGLNSVKIAYVPECLKSDIGNVKELIIKAFDVHGRWGEMHAESDFDRVSAEFEGGN